MKTQIKPDLLLETRVVVPEKERDVFIGNVKNLFESLGLNGSTFNLDDQFLNTFRENGIVHRSWKAKILALKGGLAIMQKFCDVSNLPDDDSSKKAPIFKVLKPEIENFLMKFQVGMGWRERGVFWQNAGPENIKNFTKDGVIPERWLIILKETEGGKEILARFVNVQVTVPRKKRHRGEKLPESELVSKEITGEVLNNIKRLCGLRYNNDIAEVLGVHYSVISKMKKGERRLSLKQIKLLAEKFKVLAEEILNVEKEGSAKVKEMSELLKEKFVPKSMASQVLQNMYKLSGAESKIKFEHLMGWSQNTFYSRRNGLGRITIADVKKLAEIKNGLVKELLDVSTDKKGADTTFTSKSNTDDSQETKDIKKDSGSVPDQNQGFQKPKVTGFIDLGTETDKQTSTEIPVEIRLAVNKALVEAGEATIINRSKQVFLGSLILQFQDYIIDYSETDGKLVIKQKEGDEEFEFSFNELPF